MISQNITKEIGSAMKAKDEIKLSTLRMLSSALNYEKIAKQHDLTSEEEIAVVKHEAKKRLDAIEALKNAIGKETSHTEEEINERIEKEEKELIILKAYLPEEMPDTALEKIVAETISETGATISELGRTIGAVMAKVKGKADGKKVADMVKAKLS